VIGSPALVHVDGSGPGLTRAADGTLLGIDAAPVTDAATLARVARLAVPPAWRDVWISADPATHLQATGYDAAGRKQYRYHPDFRAEREHAKFDDMLAFGAVLPALRARLEPLLARAPELHREQVLALALRLLDGGLFRIGNDEYAKHDHTYGLTTLLREHVRVDGDRTRFDYRAKHGRRRVVEIADPVVAELAGRLRRRRTGPDELLAWRDERRPGGWHRVHANEVNDFLRAQAGGPYSAKEFRTFHATVLAAQALARGLSPAATARDVAEHLGNTPAVARGAYIDPRVFAHDWTGLGDADDVERHVLDDLPAWARLRGPGDLA
jgi:DNA topoisomerase IB